jgi:predicted RNase H-like nuclease (RuvC/YqgF family)
MSRHYNPTQSNMKKTLFSNNQKEFDAVSLNVSMKKEEGNNTTVPFKTRVINVCDALDETSNDVNGCKATYNQLKSKKKEVYENIRRLAEETNKKLTDKLMKFESSINQHYKEHREKLKMHENSVAGLKVEKEELANKLSILEDKLKRLESIAGLD